MFIMGRQRRVFTPEYKDEAVKLVINTGRAVATVARELGINEATWGRWVNSFKARQDAGDGALSETERAELARLRKENSELKMDRAFLKKASLFFAQEAPDTNEKRSHRSTRRRATSASPGWPGCSRCPGRVSTPGSPANPRNGHCAERIEAKIAWFHGESDEVSGAQRILVDLREDGEIISGKTVAMTMRRLGPRGICPKRWRTTTIVDHADAYPPDAAKRAWDTGVLNRIWVGDMRADLVEQARVWPTRARAKIEVGAWNALRKPAGELFLRRAPVRTFGLARGRGSVYSDDFRIWAITVSAASLVKSAFSVLTRYCFHFTWS
jgi:transposase